MTTVLLQCVIVRALLALPFVSTNSASPLVTNESHFVVVQSNSIVWDMGDGSRTEHKQAVYL